MKTKKQIIFIDPHPTVIFYKIAKLFKEKGYETVLIRLLQTKKDHDLLYNRSYDRIIDLNLSYFKINLRNLPKILFSVVKSMKFLLIFFYRVFRLKPYVVLARGPINFPIAFFRLFFWTLPYIYFPYDIKSQAYLTKKEAKESGLSDIEIWSERFCLEHSDGILHKGSPEELNFLNDRMLGDNIRIPKYHLAFHPYCLKEFIVPKNKHKISDTDGEIHTVFVGGTGMKTEKYYYDQMKSFEEILEQKIHVHLYFSSEIKFDDDKVKDEFLKNNKDYPFMKYFHIEKSFNAKDIVKEISKYDYGIYAYKLNLKKTNLEPTFGTGNKISTYLEANLPFIYPSNNLFINQLMKKYGLDLNYPENMYDLRKMINRFNYQTLMNNIKLAQEDFLMEKHFPEIELFVKDVVESRR